MKAVLFDLDQTLHDRAASLALYIAEHHERLGFAHVLLDSYRDRFVALDCGGYTDKNALFEELVRHFELPIEAEALLLDFRQRLGLHCQLFPDALDTLKTLRESGFLLGIVTNGTALLQSTKMEVAGLSPLVDAILISESEGCKKPAPQIFERAAQRLGVLPSQCYFVGDHPQNDIVAAAGVGMQTVWLRRGQMWPEEWLPEPTWTLDALAQLPGLLNGAISDLGG